MWDKKTLSVQEKRKFKRVERFFVVSVKPAGDESADWVLANLENISEGGILFNHTEPFRAGASLDITIKILPDKPPFQCVGKVVRAQKLGELTLYEAAVHFTQVASEHRVLIHQALNK